MMKVVTEADLRREKLLEGKKEYQIGADVLLTPSAQEYLRDKEIVFARKKPEDMTHIRGSQLVKKTHPRIRLRGMLDGLLAKVLVLQARFPEQKLLCEDLKSVQEYIGAVLGAEVKDSPLDDLALFGMDTDKIREMSHNVKEYFGTGHQMPGVSMGLAALELNLLRTEVRKTELCAAQAFEEGDVLGIVRHLNRLSSGIYVLFCRMNAGYYQGSPKDQPGRTDGREVPGGMIKEREEERRE